MEQRTSYSWRIQVHSTGEIIETDPSFASTEEAIEAAKKYTARNVEATSNLTITILDDKKEVVSKLEDVEADELVTRARKLMKNRRAVQKSNGANLGFEEKLWQAADRLRGHMDPAEYKHVVLGLIF